MKKRAFAKINLTLDIVAIREDGYHLLDSVMQTVSLFDTVKVSKAKDITVCCDNESIDGTENIACIAAQKFFSYVGINGGAKIKIKKRTPLAAGLGGGSSDAAAVIMLLDRLYKTNLCKQKLTEIAVSVGADVPFFLYGGTARVQGIGEKIIPLKRINNLYAVLLKNSEKESTGAMYKKVDSVSQTELYTERFVNSLNKGVIDYLSVKNVFSLVSPCQKTFDAFKETSPLCVSLSGSGPTVFALYRTCADAKKAAAALKKSGYNPITAKLN